MKIEYDTDGGFGARARLGVVILATDETLEPEFAQMTDLDGVVLYHSRIPMVPEVRADTLSRMEADLPASAGLLPEEGGIDVIGYGCTSASSVIGSDRVAAAVHSVFPGATVTDPLAALIAACRSLSVRRLGFLTPYTPEVSQRMRGRLEDAGLSIAGFGSFEEEDDRVVARIAEASIIAAAEQVAALAPCDAVFMSCTNLRCLRVIPEIESRLGVPAIASNQVLAWHMLRLAGVGDRLPQFGRLFERPLPG